MFLVDPFCILDIFLKVDFSLVKAPIHFYNVKCQDFATEKISRFHLNFALISWIFVLHRNESSLLDKVPHDFRSLFISRLVGILLALFLNRGRVKQFSAKMLTYLLEYITRTKLELFTKIPLVLDFRYRCF